VKHDFFEARRSYDDCNLGLKRNNFRIWWQRKSEMTWGEFIPRMTWGELIPRMTWCELIPRISHLLKFEQPPEIMVIHCGGNSIGHIKLHHLRCQIKDAIFN
jgi:hypothetical protein